MLRIEVPTLLNLTPQFFEALFEQHWPRYFREELHSNPAWIPLRDEFKYTSVNVSIEAFTAWLQELYDAINTYRLFTIEHIEIDICDVYEGYSYDEGEILLTFSRAEVEEQVFAWLEWFLEKLVNAEFVNRVEQTLIPMYGKLQEIKRAYNIIGYWYDTYTTSSTLWTSSTSALGIREGDYDVVHAGTWQYGFGSIWHELTDPMMQDFYIYDSKFYTENCISQIPHGVHVVMCRIHKAVADKLTIY